MAGTRHHILPKFLLKGFASKVITKAEKQDDVFVWVYRKGVIPYESKTTKVGVEKHFYGKEGELNVDDEITDIEPSFAVPLDQLRVQSDGSKVSDEKVIEFITHLSARTKHLRDSIIDTTGFLVDNLFGYLSDYDNWRAWCINHYKRHPEVIRSAIDEAMQKVQASAYKKAMARQRLKKMPVELIVAQMDDEKSNYEFLFQNLRLQLLENLPAMTKEGHIKTLAKDLVPEPRLEQYRLLHWYLRKTGEPLILGDVGCLFELGGGKKFRSMGGTEDDIKNVFLPITSHCIVVGTPLSQAPQIDVTAINEAMAKCSRDYFVCSSSSPEMNRLADLLGEEAQMLTNEEMSQVITELITES
jgi:hypothetical protein